MVLFVIFIEVIKKCYSRTCGAEIRMVFGLNEDIIETRVSLHTFQLNSRLRRQLHVFQVHRIGIAFL